MINKPPPFKGLNRRIPTIISIKGRGVINQGSGLGFITGSGATPTLPPRELAKGSSGMLWPYLRLEGV